MIFLLYFIECFLYFFLSSKPIVAAKHSSPQLLQKHKATMFICCHMKCSFVNLFEVQLRSGGIKLCYTHLVALLCPNTFVIKITVDVPLLLCSHCHSVDDSVCVCVCGGGGGGVL